ncbi:hypothetical protein AABB24_032305 [Solanum stoloniferum]|uniref:Uncharacterized protein n=1 Tax=Solanum stoloniferum TaxID=62892 RepID=A0ABD2RJ10_9SOLN
MPDPTLENFIREYMLAQHLANPNKLLVYMIRPFSSMVVLVKFCKGNSSAEEQREGNHHYKLPNASPSPHFFPSRVLEHKSLDCYFIVHVVTFFYMHYIFF